MNAEEINNQEFCALREETQLTKVNDGVEEFDIFACPIMRFPNAKKAKNGGEFFHGGHECCRVFGDTKVDATILASTIERLLNEYTSRKPDIKIVGDDA
jgi:hypothetical protein|tara:strand:- start:124 stop:420 length:297 start_codon:yes stop_codon:yes gene_type:complete